MTHDGPPAGTRPPHAGPPDAPATLAAVLATTDDLDLHLCLLDAHGTVTWVNGAWRRFATANGIDAERCSEGSDYLAVCAATAVDQLSPHHLADLRAVLGGRLDTAHFEYPCDAPGRRRWFRAWLRGFGSAGGRQVLIVHEDITATKLAEESRQESTRLLLQLQRLEALGATTHGIVHDFNNLLTVIAGNADLALLHAEARPELRELVAAIVDAARRARGLTRRMLQQARERTSERTLVDLGSVVADVVRMQRAAAPPDLQVSLAIQGTPPVLVEATQMHQLLVNLATNARQAMADRGALTFTVDATSDAAPPDHAPGGTWVRLGVADSGPGVPAALRARIFEPFFTTKPPGEGTGLGLAIVQAIALGHGGAVTVGDTPGGGATFTVWLPAAPA